MRTKSMPRSWYVIWWDECVDPAQFRNPKTQHEWSRQLVLCPFRSCWIIGCWTVPIGLQLNNHSNFPIHVQLVYRHMSAHPWWESNQNHFNIGFRKVWSAWTIAQGWPLLLWLSHNVAYTNKEGQNNSSKNFIQQTVWKLPVFLVKVGPLRNRNPGLIS